ncbi:ribosome-associated heat shock protein Hsp15 [Balneatrix alpica]|uniref:Heat shock protein 15 n=1 Tax=Balneatrix alpica TaxID=75684 RepID=A0ABV5ZGG0_9GAMM|nr:ribosome-associated heat shock protein Hsp15 [Balneatrix alpica]
MSKTTSSADSLQVRLDKWLWAARFFKTRNLAKEAIEGGKVHYNGARGKPSRHVEVGATLVIRQGFDEKTVVVEGLAEQRRPAVEAQQLYRETEDSQRKREQAAAQRKTGGVLVSDHRPNKKERRQLVRFKGDVRSGQE